MKLPKKYQGITPGEWAVFESAVANTRPGIDGVGDSDIPIVVFGTKHDECGVHGASFAEENANATIMADAPRLAAAVVKFREDMEHIIEYWNRDQNETAMADALNHIIATAEQALKDSKEWKA